MNKKNSEKTKKLMVLSSLLISLIFVNIGTILSINWGTENEFDEFINKERENPFQFEEFPVSSQPQNYSGAGENINITLHQSLINASLKEYSNLDVSNSFSESFPNFNGYKTSFINITVEDLYAPNKFLNIEDVYSGRQSVTTITYTSFEVNSNAKLDNLSIQVRNNGGAERYDINVYNASWDGSDLTPDADLNGVLSDVVQIVQADTGLSNIWINATSLDFDLDISNTDNNTFFISVKNSASIGEWIYENEGNGDDTIVYVGSIFWDQDQNLKLDLKPVDNTPKPSDINLKINDIDVTDHSSGNNLGNLITQQEFTSATDNIDFTITSGWWDVSCNVTRVQINYTKSDLIASSDFYISDSGQNAQWNVTRTGGLNYFDSRINHFNTINFTIPSIWIDNSIKVYNVTEIASSDINKNLLNNGYREVQVVNAGNGTFWYLTANSTNLLSSIDTYIDDIIISPSYIANFSSIIEFNATFSENVIDGSLNLSVYSPTDYMNNTALLSISTYDTEFFVDNWDISDDINEYGIFLVQMSWNNDTAAGFIEKYITIFADTQITTTIPKTTFDSGEDFDVEVYFGDTGLVEGIDGATLNYSINGNPLRGDNIDISRSSLGYYNISIDCNDTEFASYGDNVINLVISKEYYNNQTDSLTITIICETSAAIISPIPGTEYNSSEVINLIFTYHNTIKDIGIDGADVQYSLNGGIYRTTGITDNTDGSYSIAISATHNDFSGYGFKTIIVNASLDYYHNQSESIQIKIMGETSLTWNKIPNKAYYNSAETFNISVYYEDTEKNIGISGATVDIDVDGTLYSPTIYDNKDGWYNITIDCSDSVFYPYANFGIRVNVSASYYYNQTNTLNTIIVGEVSLTTLSPAVNSVYVEGNNFVLTVRYQDTEQSSGISGATIAYSLNDGISYNFTGVVDNTDGTYDIPIYTGDSDFLRYGFVDIIINASKHLYENVSTTFTFHRQINTVITPFLNYDLGSVRRGLNVSYTFTYRDDLTNPITQATMNVIDAQGFLSFLQNHNNGSYTIHLDSTNAVVMNDHVFIFNVSSVGNETQILQLTIDVTIKETDVENISYFDEIVRYMGDNQSIRFYFNDTTNTLPVLGITTDNIVLRNFGTGTLWNSGGFWLVDNWNNGTYILEVDMGSRSSGWYTLEVNASKFPDYDESIFLVTFYFRGNFTEINLISLAMNPPGSMLTPAGANNYTIFEGTDLNINFYLNDTDFLNAMVIGDADTYSVTFFNLVTSASGPLGSSIAFVTQSHIGTILTSNILLTPGRYLINITTSKVNYEDAWFTFNLTINEKYQTNLTVVFAPTQINAGDELTIIFKAEYYNGTSWLPIVNGAIRMTPYFNGLLSTVQNDNTNISGEVHFVIITGSNVRNINITIELIVAYNYQDRIYNIPATQITVIPPTPPLDFEDFLPYIIIIGATLAVVVIAVVSYRGVVVPKKKEKQRILTEVKTIFDDAINLEHILVLYKGTGTCIFFKSYGSEQIDPELIGGFLSAVSSFGKEMATQAALNEISYGDKMLLLADGYLIRVALVLGKNASLILRRHLKEFIESFEKTYKDILPNWRGQLNHFKNAGLIVDDVLNTSIILPHQISYDFASVKDLKNPHSKEVLKVAQSCCEEAEREFFFIATLLKDASEMTNKETSEIFMGIKELRDKKLLIPIEISAIEAQPISQQELNLINQKVAAIANLTNEEKQKLVQDLAQLGPIEREAYLTSLTKRAEIVTAPIKSTVEGVDVDNKKSAKKGIKELLKRGKLAQGKKDYIKAVELYGGAAILASNWELHDDFVKVEEIIRKTKIEDLKEKKTNLEKEAKAAVKGKVYAEAAAKYKYASKMASEIFKLGDTSMTKEVKRLTNKSNEYEKLK